MSIYWVGIHPVTGKVALGVKAARQLGPGAVIERVQRVQLQYRAVLRHERSGRWRLGPKRSRKPGEVIVVERPFRWSGVWGAPRPATSLVPRPSEIR